MFERRAWEFHRELGEKYGPVVKIRGPFGDTQLFTFDPLAVHHILVKDQHIFEETSEFFVANRLVLGIGLLSTNGEHHRRQRKLLNPAFSTNNLRDMLPLFYRVAYSLRQAIASSLRDGPQEIDAMSWFSRTSLELVGQGTIGHSFDPLVEEKSDPYGEAMKSLIPTAWPMFIFQMLLPVLDKIGSPKLLRRLLEVTPYPRLQRVREIVDVMDCKSQEIFQEKKLALERGDEALMQQVGEGKDIMSRLLRANMTASEEDKLPDHELLGQISTFFLPERTRRRLY
ncbi:hypothetical protein A0H81_06898 [Grifola frondosa]|uniref:Cytochrome P450 n=1 Tax=Grifola frondosa TaxID=5627 RepID=A0A1C7M8N4_GRIFR|nr:hypothetical protein A0H81_06898 [Grifola frondosa]